MKDSKYKALFNKDTLDSSVKQRIEDNIYMLNFKLEVGETEKHTVEFVLNQFWGYVNIKVDGQSYIQKKLMEARFKKNWTFDVKVGKDEIHDVRIELVSSLFPVGLRECSAWVYVDDKKTGEYSGKLSVKDKLFNGMNLRIKTTIVSVMTIFAVLLIALIVYSMPIRIDTEMDGILFRGGDSQPDYSEAMSIVIDGKYHRRLFSYDQFVGKMYIQDLNPEVDDEVLQQKIIINFYNGMTGQLSYWKINLGTFSGFISVGYIYMKPNGKELMILVNEVDENEKFQWYGNDAAGLFYAAPCSSRQEALDIVNPMSQEVWSKDVKPIE